MIRIKLTAVTILSSCIEVILFFMSDSKICPSLLACNQERRALTALSERLLIVLRLIKTSEGVLVKGTTCDCLAGALRERKVLVSLGSIRPLLFLVGASSFDPLLASPKEELTKGSASASIDLKDLSHAKLLLGESF